MTDIQAPLYSPKVVMELLGRFGLRPDKSLGQNFLIDGNILRHIAQDGGAAPGVSVYEIGPGLGVLTRELCLMGAHVTTLEKDTRLAEVLAHTLGDLGERAPRIVWGDCLEFDWDIVEPGSLLIANLPYYISTAILSRVLRSGRFSRATFLVQREVGTRIVAKPGSPDYGYLSALVGMCAQARILREVPHSAFFPAPEVKSAVVQLDIHASPDLGLLTLLEQGLAMRRKTLRNNLKAAGHDPQRVLEALSVLGLPEAVRAEVLTLEQWRQLLATLVID